MDLHAKAPLQLSAAACRHMEPAGFGRIINISTTAIKYTGVNSAHYTASKAAMETVASTIAKWGASRNILVNTIRCGVVETEMRHRIAGYTEEAYRSRVSLVPLRRPGSTDEVAALATFLASDAGAFVTREIWTVAGGD
jgi:NAD(P)-dependent dehydrogenase (short-subunit alcohol dehydrogenase family)